MTATDATFYGRRKHLNPVFWQMSFSKTRDRSIDNWLTSDESSKPAFTVLVLTLLWFLVCMAYFIFNFDILSWPYLERYGIWIVLALALVGAICSFLGLVWLRKKPFSAIAIMVLVAIVFAGHFSSYGYTLGAKIRFAMAFRHYENELDRILGPNRDTLPTPSDDYLIDRGPPIRMGFFWQRHATQRVLLVWDRSGQVISAVQSESHDSKKDQHKVTDATKPFDQAIVRAIHLQGDWYLCWLA